uniref:Uncharacterized protein n=1 Tax=Arundo donax TaxID=35708 RepID=A0A0A8ZSA2_ARUDO
MMCHLAPEYL